MEVIETPKYFVKNDKIHKYPVPDNCKVEHTGQTLYDNLDDVPKGYEKCDDCFKLPR